MKILVTGGAGFVGHHIVEHLLKNTDWEIIILDSLTYAGNLNRLTDIDIWQQGKRRVRFIWHDLKAPVSESLHNEMGKIDYVWHLAAESHVDRSLEDSIPFVMSNVLGTANLLEYIKEKQPDLKKYIQFSTDEVYGPAAKNIFHKEWDRLKPSNPYAATKGGGDLLAFAFAHSFKLPILITRSMNIVGERQHPEKFIPKTVRAVLNNDTVVIHGLPGNISSRCWIHARDVAGALLFLLEKGEVGEIYNVVGEERDVLYLANKISELLRRKKLSDQEIEYVDFHRTRPGHDPRYALDGTRLSQLGWVQKMSFDQSFEKMIKWMVEHPEWLNM